MSVKDYLTFSKRERYGILTLVVILLLVIFLPHVIPKQKIKALPISVEQQLTEKKFAAADSFRMGSLRSRYQERGYAEHPYPYFPSDSVRYGRSYDAGRYPNYAYRRPRTDMEWRPRYERTNRVTSAGSAYRYETSRRYQRSYDDNRTYRADASKFSAYQYHRSVQPSWTDRYRNNYGHADTRGDGPKDRQNLYREYVAGHTADNTRKYVPVDINTADTTAFIALPGIGTKLAARIVLFRKKLGGFTGVGQIREVYGLKDSVFVILKPYLRCDSAFGGKRDLSYDVSR